MAGSSHVRFPAMAAPLLSRFSLTSVSAETRLREPPLIL